MNEMQLIRRELAAQRRHAREIAASWISPRGAVSNEILNTYDAYFLLIIHLESSRVASHLDSLQSRSDLTHAERSLLEHCGSEFETLAAGAAAAPAITRETVMRHGSLLMQLSTLVQQLEGIAESRYGVDDWRRASHLDADSILEELRLRKQALGETRGPANG
ncbi:MAG TPA: hypothetical protein VGI35_05310 [Steroidobacteraceae bacterium]|jgi:hypothetical protein